LDRIYDFRSDTVTKPTEKMRKAMYDAEVGDDVMGEDKTVRNLEIKCADLFNKEDALFTVSGTMANQIAVMTFCQRGDQIIVHDRSHIYNLEVAGISATSGVQPRALPAPKGEFDFDLLLNEIHKASIQQAPVVMICLENTFDLNRGLILDPEYIDKIGQLAKEKNLRVFLDGARIFNASVKTGIPVSRICQSVDGIAFCLSKGLACPVGSILLGSKEFIAQARRMRQRLGGGWRQAGILAAAGLVAMEEMIDRLEEDHGNAEYLARELKDLGLKVNLEQVQTNIVNIELTRELGTSEEFGRRLSEKGVKVKAIGPYNIRMVTHKDVTRENIGSALEIIRSTIKNIR